MKKKLSVAEVAEESGVSEKAVRQRIARGQLPYRRWGRRVVIFRSELDEWRLFLPGVSPAEAAERGEAGNAG
jgi:excisionase family DNA binding protein